MCCGQPQVVKPGGRVIYTACGVAPALADSAARKALDINLGGAVAMTLAPADSRSSDASGSAAATVRAWLQRSEQVGMGWRLQESPPHVGSQTVLCALQRHAIPAADNE